MKKLSLQWRITLMTALLICSTCMAMNWLIGCSGRHYMDSIGANLSTAIDPSEGAVEYFDPSREGLDPNLTIVIYGAQTSFTATNWYITAAVTLLGGILAYFVSGRALRPLRTFVAQVELFSAEHPDVLPETADFLRLLREQTERMTQMTRTLLEMCGLQAVPCTDHIELGPMIDEIFADLAPLAEKNNITLERDGDGVMTGSDTLIYRLLFNLTENAIKYNRPGGSVRLSVTPESEKLLIRVADTGRGIPEHFQRSVFQPFFRVDKSRSREYGSVGLGLSLVWEIVKLHGGTVCVENNSEAGTTVAVSLPLR